MRGRSERFSRRQSVLPRQRKPRLLVRSTLIQDRSVGGRGTCKHPNPPGCRNLRNFEVRFLLGTLSDRRFVRAIRVSSHHGIGQAAPARTSRCDRSSSRFPSEARSLVVLAGGGHSGFDTPKGRGPRHRTQYAKFLRSARRSSISSWAESFIPPAPSSSWGSP